MLSLSMRRYGPPISQVREQGEGQTAEKQGGTASHSSGT